ncbi:hypothetical protein CFOL_v3_15840, partial [Cephalotus follicularis]
WLAVGDFNEVNISTEKMGCSPVNLSHYLGFSDCINNMNMVDLSLVGPKFTWSNLQSVDSLILERLDRARATTNWKVSFPKNIVYHLPRMSSDRCPILMDTNPPK